ncbi:unnamed protein product [Microthlaspi erraticum]|uniref:Uncharacterized protein n=1 Tax=Microthlaspi erraticum TaxID=1685480 RepID=A0A6D2IU38_9BRAS|nr:unnamed protein product [Microthlaspi erraticum]
MTVTETDFGNLLWIISIVGGNVGNVFSGFILPFNLINPVCSLLCMTRSSPGLLQPLLESMEAFSDLDTFYVKSSNMGKGEDSSRCSSAPANIHIEVL